MVEIVGLVSLVSSKAAARVRRRLTCSSIWHANLPHFGAKARYFELQIAQADRARPLFYHDRLLRLEGSQDAQFEGEQVVRPRTYERDDEVSCKHDNKVPVRVRNSIGSYLCRLSELDLKTRNAR